MSAERTTPPPKPRDEGARKRPYSTPRLTEYGSVAKLTQGTLTTQQDGSGGNTFKKNSCL